MDTVVSVSGHEWTLYVNIPVAPSCGQGAGPGRASDAASGLCRRPARLTQATLNSPESAVSQLHSLNRVLWVYVRY